jgi:putative two-component system response regulator
MLLDIYMPVLDGFHVLELLADNGIKDLPIIVITAESTQFNVMKTASYNVSDFICKPYDADQILGRLRKMFHMESPKEKAKDKKAEENTEAPVRDLDQEVTDTNMYISKLESIYTGYLDNCGQKDDHYRRVSDLVKIMLMEYATTSRVPELDIRHINMASKAAYFYDIGMMAVPNQMNPNAQKDGSRKGENHTQIGARIVSLNPSPSVQYFAKVASEMCMYHHERSDGEGYPRGLTGNAIPYYAQICAAAVRFDEMFVKRSVMNDAQFDFVMREMSVDKGEFTQEIFFLMKNCQTKLVNYYRHLYKSRRW